MSKVETSDNPLDDGFVPTQEWFVERVLSRVSGFVLDCGCGRGLWSRKLREKGIIVVGLELSLRTLKLCKMEGNCENLVHGSCSSLPFRDDIFDSALLIEVIEHLSRNWHDVATQEIRRVLRIDGTFVMTTPNKYVYLLLTKVGFFEDNPEHVGELTYGEAKSLFTRYFSIIDLCGKASSMNYGRFLDYFVPTRLRWNMLFVGKKANRRESSLDPSCP